MGMLRHFGSICRMACAYLWKPWLLLLWRVGRPNLHDPTLHSSSILLKVLQADGEYRIVDLNYSVCSFHHVVVEFTHLLSIVTLWVPIVPIVGSSNWPRGSLHDDRDCACSDLCAALVSFPSPADLENANKKFARTEIEAH